MCQCTPIDIDAIAVAYYAFLAQSQKESVMSPEETPRAQLDRQPDEELTQVYWIGDPEATRTSVGVVDDLVIPANKTLRLPVSIAIYLTSVQPKLFSAAPPAKVSTPKESPKE
jgi:hypothetical protein